MAPHSISYAVKGLLWLYPFDRDDRLVAVNIPPVAVNFTRCKIKVVTKSVTFNVIQMLLHLSLIHICLSEIDEVDQVVISEELEQ